MYPKNTLKIVEITRNYRIPKLSRDLIHELIRKANDRISIRYLEHLMYFSSGRYECLRKTSKIIFYKPLTEEEVYTPNPKVTFMVHNRKNIYLYINDQWHRSLRWDEVLHSIADNDFLHGPYNKRLTTRIMSTIVVESDVKPRIDLDKWEGHRYFRN